jgi:hypothetical protein
MDIENAVIDQALIDQALKEISRYALRDSGKNPLEWKVTKNKVQEPFWKKITCEAEVPIPRKNYAVDAIIHYGYEHKVEIEIRHKSSGEILGYNWPIGESGKILVEIKTEIQSWADTLRQIKRYQNELQIPKSILVCDTLTELEAQGFINQGISIYPAINLTLPIYADCSICIHVNCPMSGTQNSPVTRCIDFDTIDGWMSKNKQIEGKEF